MGIEVGSNFDMKAQLPLDSRTKVADLTARDAIAAGIRYEGLIVYVVSEATNFQLIGGILDANWEELSGGGGAGGIIPVWFADDNAPLPAILRGTPAWVFSQASDQRLYAMFKVPNSYKGAVPITLRSHFTTADNSTNNVLFKTIATLVRPANDLVTSTTHQRVSTNTAKVQSPTLSNKVQVVVNDLTDNNGLINAETVNPGDEIWVTFYRDNADTATSDVTFLPLSSEITCA